MTTTPGGASDADAALEHIVRGMFDDELERLAFGRPETPDEQSMADAAARELTRREADGPARRGELVAQEESAAPPPAQPGATGSGWFRPDLSRPRAPLVDGEPIDRETDERPWWRRSWAVIAAGALVIVAAASLAPTLAETPIGASSLDVFARDATPNERELGVQLQRQGLRLSLTPRVIAERDGDQVVAYRVIVTSPDEPSRNEVCLLMLDERALGLPTCVDRLTFVDDGMLATLSGENRLFVVLWGPTGAPSVSVLPPDDPPPQYPSSRAADAFLAGDLSDADLAYSDLLRALHPDDRLIVRVLTTTPTWDAVGALVSSASTGLWSYCVHLFQPESDLVDQLNAHLTCASRETFERDGLIAQARTAGTGVLIDWQPDDTVLVQEQSDP